MDSKLIVTLSSLPYQAISNFWFIHWTNQPDFLPRFERYQDIFWGCSSPVHPVWGRDMEISASFCQGQTVRSLQLPLPGHSRIIAEVCSQQFFFCWTFCFKKCMLCLIYPDIDFHKNLPSAAWSLQLLCKFGPLPRPATSRRGQDLGRTWAEAVPMSLTQEFVGDQALAPQG